MVADSPDALIACMDELDSGFACAGEVKTMTFVPTVNAATNIREMYGLLIVLSGVGTCCKSDEVFRTIVSSTANRAQFLHHAATPGLKDVLYVVGRSGNVTQGRIIYACFIQFSECIRHSCTFALDSVFVMEFEWMGKETKHIPRDYDDLLRHSHASDRNSFASYCSLGRGIRKLIEKYGRPMPPARMIR